MKTVTLSQEKYEALKKKEELADDMLLQVQASLEDVKHGRIRRVA